MSTVSKSYHGSGDPIIEYCTKHTVKQIEIQQQLLKDTLEKADIPGMIGAPEVLQLGQNFIHLIHAKKAIDVGTFTGASALAWALALPDDGKVVSLDISHENLNNIGRPLLEKRPEILKKIDFRLGPALETLDGLIAAGETGKWDFAFIDADKVNYSNYYERLITLLRSGGVILVDNTLWGGRVVQPNKDANTAAIDALNKRAFDDPRTYNALVNLGDGTHIIFKK